MLDAIGIGHPEDRFPGSWIGVGSLEASDVDTLHGPLKNFGCGIVSRCKKGAPHPGPHHLLIGRAATMASGAMSRAIGCLLVVQASGHAAFLKERGGQRFFALVVDTPRCPTPTRVIDHDDILARDDTPLPRQE